MLPRPLSEKLVVDSEGILGIGTDKICRVEDVCTEATRVAFEEDDDDKLLSVHRAATRRPSSDPRPRVLPPRRGNAPLASL